jgi:hypothetical protein
VSSPDQPADLIEMAAAAAEAGDIAAFCALRRGLPFGDVIADIALLKHRWGWDAQAVFLIHMLLALEDSPPTGVEVSLDLAAFLTSMAQKVA